MVGIVKLLISGLLTWTWPIHHKIAEAASTSGSHVGVSVVTSRGTVRGFHVEDALKGQTSSGLGRVVGDVFLGVPYAAPPTGSARFKESILHGPYSKVIQAHSYGPFCPHLATTLKRNDPSFRTSEDCLTLNIFTPRIPAPNAPAKYPVIVMMQGSGLLLGDKNNWGYRGILANIVSRQVLFVSVNYRIGFFGFFTTNSSSMPPNRGIRDQLTALKWIQEEISNFGGDPKSVTIMGHSAEMCGVSCLLNTPAATDGLFHKVIVQSIPAKLCFRTSGRLKDAPEALNKKCGLSGKTGDATYAAMLEQCVEALSASDMVKYDQLLDPWGIVVDGVLFKENPGKLGHPQIPVLLGSTADEFSFFEKWQAMDQSGDIIFNDKNLAENIAYYYEKLNNAKPPQDIFENAKKEYKADIPAVMRNTAPGNASSSKPTEQIIFEVRVMTDVMATNPMADEAKRFIDCGNHDVWVWQFDFGSDFDVFFGFGDFQPAHHGIELNYFLQPDELWMNADRAARAKEFAVANQLAEEFTAFAKFGRPTDRWRRFEKEKLNYLDVGGSPTAETTNKDGFGAEHSKFWHFAAEEENKDKDKSVGVKIMNLLGRLFQDPFFIIGLCATFLLVTFILYRLTPFKQLGKRQFYRTHFRRSHK